MIFIPTLIAFLVALILNMAGLISVSAWVLLAIWPGIWLAWYIFWFLVLVFASVIGAMLTRR